jgi:5-methylcytosine-specific restriction endonuclease McrA
MCTSPSCAHPLHHLTAEELHLYILKTFRLNNKVRHRLLRAILAMDETRQYLEVGSRDMIAYQMTHFRISESAAYQWLDVARKLPSLPRCAALFEEGKISWSELRVIASVAKTETEEEWLAFAKDKTLRQIEVEVRDARKKGRTKPRGDHYGLPDIIERLIFNLKLSEKAIVIKAFRKLAAEMGERAGGEPVPYEKVLLLFSELILKTDPEGQIPGRKEREDPLETVLYHRCPDCARSREMTEDGPVEVDPRRVERIEGQAKLVSADERDRPNPERLVRIVWLRDGARCQNPHCGRTYRRMHAHHIVFRSRGGRTVLSNEVLVCVWCHAIIHDGFLDLDFDRDGKHRWTTAADKLEARLAAEKPGRCLGDEGAEVASLPLVYVQAPAGTAAGPVPAPAAAPAAGAGERKFHSVENPAGRAEESPELKAAYERAFQALKALGHSATEAKKRLDRVRKKLAEEVERNGLGRPPTDGDLVKLALRA